MNVCISRSKWTNNCNSQTTYPLLTTITNLISHGILSSLPSSSLAIKLLISKQFVGKEILQSSSQLPQQGLDDCVPLSHSSSIHAVSPRDTDSITNDVAEVERVSLCHVMQAHPMGFALFADLGLTRYRPSHGQLRLQYVTLIGGFGFALIRALIVSSIGRNAF
jgi:hypothetical protein